MIKLLLLSTLVFANAVEKAKNFHKGPRIIDGPDIPVMRAPEPPENKAQPPSPSPSEKEVVSQEVQEPEPEIEIKYITPPPQPIVPLLLQKIYYPLHSTPESLSSLSYGYHEGIHYVIPRIQFHMGQYKFLEDILPDLKTYLVLQPRLNFGFIYTSTKQMSYYVSTDNRFSMGQYGVGFKVLIEGTEIDFKKTDFNGMLSSYVYKNMNVGEAGKMSIYLGFHSERLTLKGEPYKYAKAAKELLFNSENAVAGLWYQPNVLAPSRLSYSFETNAQNFVSLSVYYGLN